MQLVVKQTRNAIKKIFEMKSDFLTFCSFTNNQRRESAIRCKHPVSRSYWCFSTWIQMVEMVRYGGHACTQIIQDNGRRGRGIFCIRGKYIPFFSIIHFIFLIIHFIFLFTQIPFEAGARELSKWEPCSNTAVIPPEVIVVRCAAKSIFVGPSFN